MDISMSFIIPSAICAFSNLVLISIPRLNFWRTIADPDFCTFHITINYWNMSRGEWITSFQITVSHKISLLPHITSCMTHTIRKLPFAINQLIQFINSNIIQWLLWQLEKAIYCDVHAVGQQSTVRRLFTAVAMQRNNGNDQRFLCGPFR
jgi:hypothetical protein